MADEDEDDQGEPWARREMTPRMQERLDAYRKFIEKWKEQYGDADSDLDSQP